MIPILDRWSLPPTTIMYLVGQNEEKSIGLQQEPYWEKREREAAERMSVDYEPLDQRPELLKAVAILLSNLNTFSAKNGGKTILFNTANIRLVDENDFSKVTTNLKLRQNSDGFYDDDNSAIFLSCNRERIDIDTQERLWILYGIAHELGHHAMPNLDELSFHLSEGLADYVVRDIVDDKALQMAVGSDKVDIPYCRPKQLDMVDQINESLGVGTFNDLLTNALKGAGYIQGMLDKMFGPDFMTLLKKDDNESIEDIVTVVKRSSSHLVRN